MKIFINNDYNLWTLANRQFPSSLHLKKSCTCENCALTILKWNLNGKSKLIQNLEFEVSTIYAFHVLFFAYLS